ncbi:hypothetical protein AGMMS49545_09180 [Betaproteobacteria bacterium]|nr:hypothetical protein AGMMS49545_09180 [Betaproteobacteria bacterium]GHU48009.1 hypothetical protein AGMMS50289_24040 [Betaproteobacteria bacterium]
MTAITFDTLQVSRKLQARGFKIEQAEGISETLQEIINVAEVATTRDIKELELTIKAKIEVKLAETKAEIIKWNIGAVIGSVGLAVTLIKMFG